MFRVQRKNYSVEDFAVIWDKLEAISIRSPPISEKVTSPAMRLLWFLRSPHHTDASSLFDASIPAGSSNSLVALKKRQLIDMTFGAVPISYKYVTRKFSVVNNDSEKKIILGFSRLSDEVFLSHCVSDLNCVEFSKIAAGASDANGNSRSDSSNFGSKRGVFLPNKFGLLLVIDASLDSVKILLMNYNLIESILALCESDLYTAFSKLQNGTDRAEMSSSGVEQMFGEEAHCAFRRLISDMQNLSRSPFVSIAPPTNANDDAVKVLAANIIAECCKMAEQRESNYFVSCLLSMLFRALYGAIPDSKNVSLTMDVSFIKSYRWILTGKNSHLEKSLVIAILVFLRIIIARFLNGGTITHITGAYFPPSASQILPCFTVTALAPNDLQLKSLLSSKIRLLRANSHTSSEFCVANISSWSVIRWIIDSSMSSPSLQQSSDCTSRAEMPSPGVVSLLERFILSTKFGIPKPNSTEYLVHHAVLYSVKRRLCDSYRRFPESLHNFRDALDGKGSQFYGMLVCSGVNKGEMEIPRSEWTLPDWRLADNVVGTNLVSRYISLQRQQTENTKKQPVSESGSHLPPVLKISLEKR